MFDLPPLKIRRREQELAIYSQSECHKQQYNPLKIKGKQLKGVVRQHMKQAVEYKNAKKN